LLALGVILAYSGRPKEGLAALETCIRLDPRAPSLVNRLNQVALAHYFCRDYEAAVEAAERAIRSFSNFASPYRWLAAALGELGRTAEAKEVLEKAIAVSPASFDFQVRERPPWFRPEDHAHIRCRIAKNAARKIASNHAFKPLQFRPSDARPGLIAAA